MRRLRFAICAALSWIYDRIPNARVRDALVRIHDAVKPAPTKEELSAELAALNELRAGQTEYAQRLRAEALANLANDPNLTADERRAWARQMGSP